MAALVGAAAGPASADVEDRAPAQGCSVDATKPVGDSDNRVRGTAWTVGCGEGWAVAAYLQSSRWHGWNNDVTVRLGASDRKNLEAGCAGTHEYRIKVYATYGTVADREKITDTVTMRCG